MARLVSEPMMTAIENLLANQSGLADTLALMLDDTMRQEVEQGAQEATAGQVRDAREFFNEL